MNPDWEKWATRGKHAGKIFVRDGVICSDSWQQARSKKIFLLKEAWWGKDDKKADWWENDDCWDLSKLFRRWKKPKHKMWWLVGIWGGMLDKRAKGEELAGLDPNYSNDPAVTQGLFSSAVVNLKKSDGKKSSDPKDLQEYVEQDWDLLLSQIVDLKPDVVLCGSTWRFVKPLLKKDDLL